MNAVLVVWVILEAGRLEPVFHVRVVAQVGLSRKVSCPCRTLSRADSWASSGLLPAPASSQLWHPLAHSSLLTTHQFPGCSWSPLLRPSQWLASLAWTKTPLWRTVCAGLDESRGGRGRSGSKPGGRAERESSGFRPSLVLPPGVGGAVETLRLQT